MSKKILLRVAASPLTPAHVACALRDVEGAGFSHKDAPWLSETYHQVALQAAAEAIASDRIFQAAIQGQVYAPTQKAISKLTPRNQFMALAPCLALCPAGENDGNPLPENDPMHRAAAEMLAHPFVLTFRHFPLLRALSASTPGPIVSSTKLEGFVEHYLGASSALFVE